MLEIKEIMNSTPVKAGSAIDKVQLETWDKFAKQGIVTRVKKSQLGFSVSGKNSRIYLLPSGDEVWLGVNLGEDVVIDGVSVGGRRNLDFTQVGIETNADGKIKKVKFRGMDNHSLGPSHPEANSNHKAHFTSKKETLKGFKKIVKKNFPDIDVTTKFDEADSFFYKERLDEIDDLERKIKKTKKLTKTTTNKTKLKNLNKKLNNLNKKLGGTYKAINRKNSTLLDKRVSRLFSPTGKAIARSIGASLTALGIGYKAKELMDAEMLLYKSPTLWNLVKAIRDNNKLAIRGYKKKLKDVSTDDVIELQSALIKLQPIAGGILPYWSEIIDLLADGWEKQAAEIRKEIEERKNEENNEALNKVNEIIAEANANLALANIEYAESLLEPITPKKIMKSMTNNSGGLIGSIGSIFSNLG